MVAIGEDRIDRRTILVATNILRGLAFIALYLVGLNASLNEEYDTKDLPKMDRRKELLVVPFTDGDGQPIPPGSAAAGAPVAHGVLKNTPRGTGTRMIDPVTGCPRRF